MPIVLATTAPSFVIFCPILFVPFLFCYNALLFPLFNLHRQFYSLKEFASSFFVCLVFVGAFICWAGREFFINTSTLDGVFDLVAADLLFIMLFCTTALHRFLLYFLKWSLVLQEGSPFQETASSLNNRMWLIFLLSGEYTLINCFHCLHSGYSYFFGVSMFMISLLSAEYFRLVHNSRKQPQNSFKCSFQQTKFPSCFYFSGTSSCLNFITAIYLLPLLAPTSCTCTNTGPMGS